MSYVETGKWTCPHPSCRRTVVIDATEPDTSAAIVAVQKRHAKAHRAAAAFEARLRKIDPLMPGREWGAA